MHVVFSRIKRQNVEFNLVQKEYSYRDGGGGARLGSLPLSPSYLTHDIKWLYVKSSLPLVPTDVGQVPLCSLLMFFGLLNTQAQVICFHNFHLSLMAINGSNSLHVERYGDWKIKTNLDHNCSRRRDGAKIVAANNDQLKKSFKTVVILTLIGFSLLYLCFSLFCCARVYFIKQPFFIHTSMLSYKQPHTVFIVDCFLTYT